VIGEDDHLLLVGQVDTDDRVLRWHEYAETGQSSVAVTVASRAASSVAHERPPPAMGHQARQAHQEDVSTSVIDTQSIYLRRVGEAQPTGVAGDLAYAKASSLSDSL
jgi:hypothetical protein